MNWIKKHTSLILGVALIIAVILLIRQCQSVNRIKRNKRNVYEYLTDSISYITTRKGEIIAERNALRGDKEELKILLANTSEKLKDLTERLKNVNTAIEVKTVTEIDPVKITYTDTIPYIFTRNLLKTTENYTIGGLSTNLGITIDSLKIPNTLSIVVGEDKDSYVIKATNSNPLIKTKNCKPTR